MSKDVLRDQHGNRVEFLPSDEGFVPFRMVLDDEQLVPGREILWMGSNGRLIQATIIRPLPDIAFLVRDKDNNQTGDIYIERVKFYRPGSA